METGSRDYWFVINTSQIDLGSYYLSDCEILEYQKGKIQSRANVQSNLSLKITNHKWEKIMVEVGLVEGLPSLESTEIRNGRRPWSFHQGDELSH